MAKVEGMLPAEDLKKYITFQLKDVYRIQDIAGNQGASCPGTDGRMDQLISLAEHFSISLRKLPL